MKTQGYFQTPAAPQAPQANAPRPAAPRAYAGAGITMGTDTYRGGAAAVGIDNVAPALPGAAAGTHGYSAIKGAKWVYTKASRSRSYDRKVHAPGLASKELVENFTGAIKNSVIFGALISLGLNAYGVAKGQLKVSEAGANVASDTASAVVGGAAGFTASSLATWALIGPMGTGVYLNLIALGAGMAGYLVGEHFFRQTDLHRVIREKTQAALGKIAD